MTNVLTKQMDLLVVHNGELLLEALLTREEPYIHYEEIPYYNTVIWGDMAESDSISSIAAIARGSSKLNGLRPNLIIIDDIYNSVIDHYKYIIDADEKMIGNISGFNLCVPFMDGDQHLFNFDPPIPLTSKQVTTNFLNTVGKRRKKGGKHTW